MLDAATVRELRAIVGDDALLIDVDAVRAYECDGLTNFRVLPLAVVLPKCTEEVQAVVRVCHRLRMPFVAAKAMTVCMASRA